jgi:hypothetical protein
VELMLESWVFSLRKCVNKDNQINFVNYKFTVQSFGRNIRAAGAKNRTLFDFLIGFWHSK